MVYPEQFTTNSCITVLVCIPFMVKASEHVGSCRVYFYGTKPKFILVTTNILKRMMCFYDFVM